MIGTQFVEGRERFIVVRIPRGKKLALRAADRCFRYVEFNIPAMLVGPDGERSAAAARGDENREEQQWRSKGFGGVLKFSSRPALDSERHRFPH